jgi:hypothetical protein
MVLDAKKWEQLAKLIEQEHERGPVRHLLKRIAEQGNLGSSVTQRLGKLTEERRKREESTLEKKHAGQGCPSVIEGKQARGGPLSFVEEFLQRERMAFDRRTWERVFERLNQEHPPIQPAILKRPRRSNLASRERHQVAANPDTPSSPPDFFTFTDLMERWGCSWGTVQNWLRADHVQVLDRAPRGKRGKKVVARKDVLEFERRNTKRLR